MAGLKAPAKRVSPRNSSDDPEEFRATLGEHLDDLRSRLVRSVVLLCVGLTVGWFLQPWVYQHLSDMARSSFTLPEGIEYREAFRSVTEPFMLKLKVAFYIGLTLVFPLIVTQIWGFIEPGLKPHEKMPLRKIAPISVLLFIVGAYFCWMILPSALNWFVGYVTEFQGTSIIQEPGTLVFFILKMLLAFGIGFQLPVVVFFLAKIGLLSVGTLGKYWRQATVILFFGSALITPSNDIFSMLMMAVPLTILFFASIWAVKLTNRGLQAAED